MANCHRTAGVEAKNMRYPLCFSHNIILSFSGEVCTFDVDLFLRGERAREMERVGEKDGHVWRGL